MRVNTSASVASSMRCGIDALREGELEPHPVVPASDASALLPVVESTTEAGIAAPSDA